MVDVKLEFDQRVNKLMRKHRALSRGYSTRMRADGLIVAKPRRVRSGVSVRTLLLFLAAFFVFKAFLLAHLGGDVYDERVQQLQLGTPVEQGGAWIMQSDQLTELLAATMAPYIP